MIQIPIEKNETAPLQDSFIEKLIYFFTTLNIEI